jgi:mannose-6-phosphate isomerase-like protein (cupin superfamily)
MTHDFITRHLAEHPDAIAPDGSEVRLLASAQRGSMAHFELPSGKISAAVAHRTVEEVWFFTSGQGRLWRKIDSAEETIDVHPGVSISIPVGCHVQFRSDGDWPGMHEAFAVTGTWKPSA